MKTKKIPEIGFLRLRDVIGGKDNPGIIPVRRSSRAEGIAEGRYPKMTRKRTLGDSGRGAESDPQRTWS
jgi:hypothetical protein